MNLYICFSHQFINASQFLSALSDRKQLLSVNAVQRLQLEADGTKSSNRPYRPPPPIPHSEFSSHWRLEDGGVVGGRCSRGEISMLIVFFKMVNTKEVV